MSCFKGGSAGIRTGKSTLAGVAIVAIIVAAHLTYIGNGFVWLDHGDIEQGRALIPLSHWLNAFGSPYAFTGFYRPLVTLLHCLDARLWGIQASGFHVTNILLHVLAACAAPLFIGTFFPLSHRERLAAVLVFGLHPLSMLPAGCVSFRSESLMALFTFLSVWLYGKVRVPGRPYRLAALFLSIVCACFSKETAFFYLPVFFFMVQLTRLLQSVGARGAMASPDSPIAVPTRKAVRSAVAGWPAAITTGAALAGVWYLRHRAMPVAWCITGESLAPLERVGTALTALGRHLFNLVSPLLPQVSDPITITGIAAAAPIFVAAVCLAACILALRGGIAAPGTTMLFLTAISLMPSLNLLPLPRFYSPHYAYLAVAPGTGLVIALMRSARRSLRDPLPLVLSLMSASWVAAAAITTVIAGGRLQSDLTLFMPEVTRDSRFSEGWFYCGNCLRATSRFSEAQTAYDQGLLPAPGCIRFFPETELLINQSALAVQRNDLVSADSLMRVARECSPAAFQPDIAYIRADIAMRAGEYDTVIAFLANKDENLQRPESCRLLGDALSVRGKKEEAEKMYRRGNALADSASP